MNEKLVASVPEVLEEAPTLRLEDLPNADLKDQDLTKIEGLLPEHLAGADLTGAKLPEEIAKFPALDQVTAISSEARKIFIGLLAACVYSWLVIGTTTDVALIVNTSSSPLPIINTPIPIAGFYVIGATLLAAVYCYFHFYLQRLWRTIATLPAVFPDGTPLDDRTDPWLLTNLVRTDFARLRANAPPLARLENLLSIVLAWWLGPVTILLLWARYLPAHYIGGLVWLAFLIAGTTFFGVHSFQLARATLRRNAPPTSKARTDDGSQPLLLRILGDARHLPPEEALFAFVFPCALLTAMSLSVVLPSPRNTPFSGARFLSDIGLHTSADLREVAVAQRPEGWDGKDRSKVKAVDLRDRNLAFADAGRAFLANADLRGANLTSAFLPGAQLQGANLYGAQLQGADLSHAQLQGADLTEAQLQGAFLPAAQLQGAVLGGAQLQGAVLGNARLQGAELSGAQLQGAHLYGAQLQGAHLSHAQLQGADLTEAQLQGAVLDEAELQGARLYGAQLQGAVLYGAQLQGANLFLSQLQGADLRNTALWRASVWSLWDYGDLRGANVQPMSNSEIGALVTEATKYIPDEEMRKMVAKGLNADLRTEEIPARPNFPEEWRSKPNVMFDPRRPPPPDGWGPREWPTEEDYDADLAKFLGDLACESNEAQTRGLALRAILEYQLEDELGDHRRSRLFAARLINSDCPPASALPDDMRSELEALAAGRGCHPCRLFEEAERERPRPIQAQPLVPP